MLLAAFETNGSAFGNILAPKLAREVHKQCHHVEHGGKLLKESFSENSRFRCPCQICHNLALQAVLELPFPAKCCPFFLL